MKKVVIAEDEDGILYVFESLYDYAEYNRTNRMTLKHISIYEYAVINSDGLMIKYSRV